MATQAFGNKEISFSRLPHVSEKRGLFIVLGLVLLLLGGVALYLDVYTTLLTVEILGMLLFLSGIFHVIHALLSSQWQGFLVNLLVGGLHLLMGTLLITNPAIAAMTLTLLIASFLLVSGLFRMLVAAVTRFIHWGWFLATGLVSALLGGWIWYQWPISGLFIIGLFVGIELLMAGIIVLALAMTSRNADRLKA